MIILDSLKGNWFKFSEKKLNTARKEIKEKLAIFSMGNYWRNMIEVGMLKKSDLRKNLHCICVLA